MEKLARYVFNRHNLFYPILLIPIGLMLIWEYRLGNYKLSIFQALCFGIVLNSWLFAYLQKKINLLRAD